MRVGSTLDPPIIFILFEEHSPFNDDELKLLETPIAARPLAQPRWAA
jgi:hypothetical protein